MVATDVSSLFPSMNAVEAGRACKERIQDSDMEFEDVELVEMLLYIKLNQDKVLNTQKLRPWLPKRRRKDGIEPTIKFRQIRGPRKLEELSESSMWESRGAPSDPTLRKIIIGSVIEIANRVLFGAFTYTVGGKIFLQTDGGPTGTRIAMAVGQILMEWLLLKLKKFFFNSQDIGIKLKELILYVDDGRTFCSLFEWGTRFDGDKFSVTQTAFEQDKA